MNVVDEYLRAIATTSTSPPSSRCAVGVHFMDGSSMFIVKVYREHHATFLGGA